MLTCVTFYRFLVCSIDLAKSVADVLKRDNLALVFRIKKNIPKSLFYIILNVKIIEKRGEKSRFYKTWFNILHNTELIHIETTYSLDVQTKTNQIQKHIVLNVHSIGTELERYDPAQDGMEFVKYR